MNKSSWIKDLSHSFPTITLNNLLLPGTHNSCCHKLNLNLLCNLPIVSHIIHNWTINQDISVYKQLKSGVRMLDIDVSYINNKFYTSHTFIIDELEQLIEQLQKFNNEYNDIYIIKFICRDNINNDNVNALANIINNIFKDKIIYPKDYSNVLNTPIDIFIQNKKNMLIYMEYTNHMFFNSNADLYSSWTNDNSVEDSLINNKNMLMLMNNFKTKNSNVLNDLNWTLTPTSTEIIYGIFCCYYYHNIKSWIEPFNKIFVTFYNNNIELFSNINCVSFDFINNNIIELIFDINSNKINNLIK